mmetsp:Transcript_17003/g.45873  ORF Transcript_17003/g.45873 Transcript_17003/m.45873 type:complete len:479 (+) Transcript_17003:535-1971(+)
MRFHALPRRAGSQRGHLQHSPVELLLPRFCHNPGGELPPRRRRQGRGRAHPLHRPPARRGHRCRGHGRTPRLLGLPHRRHGRPPGGARRCSELPQDPGARVPGGARVHGAASHAPRAEGLDDALARDPPHILPERGRRRVPHSRLQNGPRWCRARHHSKPVAGCPALPRSGLPQGGAEAARQAPVGRPPAAQGARSLLAPLRGHLRYLPLTQHVLSPPLLPRNHLLHFRGSSAPSHVECVQSPHVRHHAPPAGNPGLPARLPRQGRAAPEGSTRARARRGPGLRRRRHAHGGPAVPRVPFPPPLTRARSRRGWRPRPARRHDALCHPRYLHRRPGYLAHHAFLLPCHVPQPTARRRRSGHGWGLPRHGGCALPRAVLVPQHRPRRRLPLARGHRLRPGRASRLERPSSPLRRTRRRKRHLDGHQAQGGQAGPRRRAPAHLGSRVNKLTSRHAVTHTHMTHHPSQLHSNNSFGRRPHPP